MDFYLVTIIAHGNHATLQDATPVLASSFGHALELACEARPNMFPQAGVVNTVDVQAFTPPGGPGAHAPGDIRSYRAERTPSGFQFAPR